MTDALTAAPAGPSTDVLDEQVETPKAQENLMPEQQPEDTPEPKADKSAEEKRSDSVKKAIDKALDDKPEAEPEKEKPEPKAKAEPKDDPKADETPEDAPEAEVKAEAEPEAPKKPTAYKEAPSGFDDAAKAEWEKTPESVRGAVNRRLQEMERGIHKHKADAEQFNSVRQYAELAKQHGTDLPTALQRYTTMEQTLRQNPMQGLQAVVANLDLKKPDGTPVTLRDVAASITGQAPNAAASQQEAMISQLTHQVQSLTQQLGSFSQQAEQEKEQAKVTTAENEWSTFQKSADYPRATELEADIAEALQMQNPEAYPSLSERLRHAYAVAVSQNPSVAHTDPEPLVQTQPPATKQINPAGQKSISGAPSGDTKASSRKLSRRESIDKAMRAAGI